MGDLSTLAKAAFPKISSYFYFKSHRHFLSSFTFPKKIPSYNQGKSLVTCIHPSQQRRYNSTNSNKYIVSSPLGEISFPSTLLFHEIITQNWSIWERKVAVECAMTGKKIRYKEMNRLKDILAASLQNKLKLKKGDIIGMVLLNGYEFPLIILACSMCGIIPSPSNPVNTVDELIKHFKDCNVKAIFTNPGVFSKCKEVLSAMEVNIPIVNVPVADDTTLPEEGIAFNDLLDANTAGSFTDPKITQQDVVVLPYSSGTTGMPKGVVLTHKNLVANITQLSHPESSFLDPTTRFFQDSVFGILPMYHIYGLIVITFNTLKEGCRLLILPKFEPIIFIKKLIWRKAKVVFVAPPIIQFFALERIKGWYLHGVRMIINAASPLPEKHSYILLEKAKHIKLIQGYGMTETSPVLSHTCTMRTHKLLPIGIPVASTKFKIVDLKSGELLPAGKQGELCVTGPQIMTGYYNRPEETKNIFDADGWLKTGDVSYYDDDGDFFIVERLKDLIKVKGFQVAPGEIEIILKSHPKIKDAAVAGVPDEKDGEVPRAFVVLKEGQKMTEEEVQEFVKPKVSPYKQLKGGVKFLDDLPKNNIGKVLRKQLRTL